LYTGVQILYTEILYTDIREDLGGRVGSGADSSDNVTRTLEKDELT